MNLFSFSGLMNRSSAGKHVCRGTVALTLADVILWVVATIILFGGNGIPLLPVAELLEAARGVGGSLPIGCPSANPPVDLFDFVVM